MFSDRINSLDNLFDYDTIVQYRLPRNDILELLELVQKKTCLNATRVSIYLTCLSTTIFYQSLRNNILSAGDFHVHI